MSQSFETRLLRGLSKLGATTRGMELVDVLTRFYAGEGVETLGAWADFLLHWTHASASQLKTKDQCDRKWWYNKIARMRTEDSWQLIFGKRVHSCVEHYLATGRVECPPDEDWSTWPKASASRVLPCARALVPHVPEPFTTGWDSEYPMHLVLPGAAVPLIGAMDILQPGHVTDIKTTKDIEWAMSPERLKYDLQAQAYAIAERYRTPGLDSYKSTWLYVTRETPIQAETRECSFNNDELDDATSDLVRRINEMHALTLLNAPDVAATGLPNQQCWAYRRQCDFMNLCVKDGNRSDPSAPDPASDPMATNW